MKKSLRNSFLSCMAAGTLFTSCQTDSLPAIKLPRTEVLDSILDSYVTNGYYPFLYARLEDKEGRVIYEHGRVNQELLPGVEVDGESWIRIWSMSKIVTISTVLDLIEDGILNLNDPVSKFIPEFAEMKVAVTEDGIPLAELDPERYGSACPYQLVPADSVMTILHLINHQAGFYYSVTGIPCLDSLQAAMNLPSAENSEELIRRMATLPLIQHPGTTYFYGTNTTVLGLVAERATGKSLKQLVEERVTGPLGIEGLQYGLPAGASIMPRFSGRDTILREAHPGELDIFGEDLPRYDPEYQLYLGGEGMVATADGYADFLRMLLQGGELNGARMLEESTVRDIHSPHTQVDNPYGYNGYNLWVSSDSMRAQGTGDAGLWIGGGYEGTHFWVDPEREFVGVIMSQMFWVQPGGYGRDDAIRGEIYRQLFKMEGSQR